METREIKFKTMIKVLIAWLLIVVVMYLAGCFICLSFDLNEWHIVGRMFVAVMSLLSLIFLLENKDKF
jgi:hypothetical protein